MKYFEVGLDGDQLNKIIALEIYAFYNFENHPFFMLSSIFFYSSLDYSDVLMKFHRNKLEKREKSWIRCSKKIGGGWKKLREEKL